MVNMDRIDTSQTEITLVMYFEQGKIQIILDTEITGWVLSPFTIKEDEVDVLSKCVKLSESSKNIGWEWKGWQYNGKWLSDAENPENSALTEGKLSDDMIRDAENNNRTITFTSKWVEKEYVIVLDTKGWTITGWTDSTNRVKLGDEYPVPKASQMSAPNIVFKGWSTDKNGNNMITDKVEVKDLVLGSSQIFLYPQYESKRYVIEYDTNGGTGSYPDAYVPYNGVITFPSESEITPPSFTHFQRWILVMDDGQKPFAPTDQLQMADYAAFAEKHGDKIVFMMEWTSNTFWISYNMGDDAKGGFPIDGNKYTKDGDPIFKVKSYLKEDGTPYQTRTGYTMKGWAIYKDAKSPITEDGLTEEMMSVAKNSVINLYPYWQPLSFKIEYDFNGGNPGLDAPSEARYGTEISISNPTKSSYRFVGWEATDINKNTAQYRVGNEFYPWDGTLARTTLFINLTDSDGATVKFKANWESAVYGITYDLNGGTGDIENGDSRASMSDDFKLASIGKATKTGYVFAGWSINGVTPIGTSGQTIKMTETIASISDSRNIITLKAVWSTISYNVEFRVSENDPYMKIVAFYDVGSSIGIPERTGYMFNGWTSSTLGSKNAMFGMDGSVWYSWSDGKNPAKGSYIMNLTEKSGDTIKLTATWTPINYKIQYNANGGTGKVPVDDKVYKIGDKLELMPYDSLQGSFGGKIVRGWSLDRTSTSPMNIEEFNVGLAESANSMYYVTLYAVWFDGVCTVNIELNGSTVDVPPSGWSQLSEGVYSITVKFGAEVKSLLEDWPDPYMDGHIFKKWNYSMSTVSDNMVITPEFEVVSQEVVYYVAAGAVGVISLLLIASRFEWL